MISQKNTSVMDVIKKGNGTITANIRECHMETESAVLEVIDDLSSAGFNGVLDVGAPNFFLLPGLSTSGAYHYNLSSTVRAI